MDENKKFAVFDIDGTVFRYSLYLELVKELISMDVFCQADSSKILNSLKHWRIARDDRSFWQYIDLALATHEANLPNVSLETYNKAVVSTFEKNKDFVYTFPKQLMSELRTKGYLLFAISGSQTEIIEKFCNYHGFDDFIGSVHKKDVTGRHYTSETEHTHLDKTALIKALVDKHAVDFIGSIGVGDTHGDISMLELVDRPIAFNPNSKLYNYAQNKGWEIVIERKDVIYRLARSGSGYYLG